jgi:hypothetical protein
MKQGAHHLVVVVGHYCALTCGSVAFLWGALHLNLHQEILGGLFILFGADEKAPLRNFFDRSG